MRSGTTLGERYTLGDRLGVGDNGSVWTGHDTIFDQPVTIKILAAELAADESVRERFRQVALAVAGLTVPGIVAVHDCLDEPDPDGGQLVCHVTEPVAGRSLRDLLAERGPLPPREALRLVAEAATALEAAHRAGVHHGAVKPENLIVADDGAVTVVDFGFRRPKPSPYTGPERGTDAAADVFGLGAVGYECLTGRPPARDGDIAPLLAELDPVDAAPIMKALAPQPNRRFGSAAGFADACLRLESVTLDAPAASTEGDAIDVAEVSRAAIDAENASAAAETTASSAPDASATAQAMDPPVTADEPSVTVADPAEAEPSGTAADTAAPDRATDAESSVTEPASDATDRPAESARATTVATEQSTEADETETETDRSATVDEAEPPTTGTDESDPRTVTAAAAETDERRRDTRLRLLIVGAVLAVVAAFTVVAYAAIPDQSAGDRRPEPTTASPTGEASKSPSPSSTGAGQSPNSAHPAPTTGSPTPSDSPTSSDDDGVQVPFVVGKRVETAQAELSGLGFLVMVNEEGEGRQQCRVHDQNPQAGTSAPSGTTVTISVRRVNNPRQCIDAT